MPQKVQVAQQLLTKGRCNAEHRHCTKHHSDRKSTLALQPVLQSFQVGPYSLIQQETLTSCRRLQSTILNSDASKGGQSLTSHCACAILLSASRDNMYRQPPCNCLEIILWFLRHNQTAQLPETPQELCLLLVQSALSLPWHSQCLPVHVDTGEACQRVVSSICWVLNGGLVNKSGLLRLLWCVGVLLVSV